MTYGGLVRPVWDYAARFLDLRRFFVRNDTFCLQALKMAENPEKRCFTFFAFLPPYIVVSASLVQTGPYGSFFSIAWYQQYFIWHHMARC